MKVWVVMGNDFPETVLDSADGAFSFVKEQKRLGNIEAEKKSWNRPTIYWRFYEFELQK